MESHNYINVLNEFVLRFSMAENSIETKNFYIQDMPVSYQHAESPNLLVMVHGFPGHKDERQNRKVAEAVSSSNLASVLRYSSSRNWDVWDSAGKDLMKRVEAFKGKTYQQELGELQRVIEYLDSGNDGIGEPCKIKQKELFLSGHSYAGSLVALTAGILASEGEDMLRRISLKGIFLSCPQIDPQWRVSMGWGCYSGFPEKSAFKKAISVFPGRVYLAHNAEDQVVPLSQGEELFEALKTKNKKFVEIPGGDHLFSGEKTLDRYVGLHKDFLQQSTAEMINVPISQL